MRLAARVAYNTLAQLSGKIISAGLGLAAVGVMTRYLGQSGFGEFTTVIAFASAFAIIADLGLSLVTTQMINRPGANQEEALGNLLSFRLVSALLIIGLAPLTVWFFPYNQAIKIGVAVVSWSYLFFSFNQIFVSLFQKELKTHLIAIAEVASRVVLLIIVILAAGRGWGLTGILWSMVASNLLNFGLHYIFARRLACFKWQISWLVWKQIMSRSWPLLATIVLNLVYLKADVLILSLIKPQADVGLYGAAYRVVDVTVALPFMFAGLMLPILVKHWSNGARDSFKFVAQKVFDVTVLATAPLLVGGWLLARPAMSVVAGPNFIVSGSILKILLIAIVAVFFSCVFTYMMISFEEQKRLIKYYLLTALTALPVYYLAIKQYSYFGAAWGTVYSEVLIFACSAWAAWHYGRWLPDLHLLPKALGATAVMAGIIVILRFNLDVFAPAGLAITTMAGVAVYAVMLKVFGLLKLSAWQGLLEDKE
jgi:O-antigen/teichoic acid export membrane protein